VLFVDNSVNFAALFQRQFLQQHEGLGFSFCIYINHSICVYFVPSVVAVPGLDHTSLYLDFLYTKKQQKLALSYQFLGH